MALGLAIIVVVIVGVMGAGLLTLVSTDLQAVIAVNRGEQAFELAEAGSRSRKRTSPLIRAPQTGLPGNFISTAWARVLSPSPSNTSRQTGLSR